jgi:GcrA cell cycle regulator
MVDWTDERVELLRKLWSEGLSASQVAAEIGASVTRNAVIGKIHRLGLPDRAAARPAGLARNGRPGEDRQVPQAVQKSAPSAPIAPALTPIGEPAEVAIPETGRVALLDLRDSMCRWPFGHPREAGFGFCGARAIGAVYCGYHAQIAYTTPAEAKRAAAEWRKAHGKAARAA